MYYVEEVLKGICKFDFIMIWTMCQDLSNVLVTWLIFLEGKCFEMKGKNSPVNCKGYHLNPCDSTSSLNTLSIQSYVCSNDKINIFQY